MLPRDFFFVSDSENEATIEAIADETVLRAIRATGRTGRGTRLSKLARNFATSLIHPLTSLPASSDHWPPHATHPPPPSPPPPSPPPRRSPRLRECCSFFLLLSLRGSSDASVQVVFRSRRYTLPIISRRSLKRLSRADRSEAAGRLFVWRKRTINIRTAVQLKTAWRSFDGWRGFFFFCELRISFAAAARRSASPSRRSGWLPRLRTPRLSICALGAPRPCVR